MRPLARPQCGRREKADRRIRCYRNSRPRHDDGYSVRVSSRIGAMAREAGTARVVRGGMFGNAGSDRLADDARFDTRKPLRRHREGRKHRMQRQHIGGGDGSDAAKSGAVHAGIIA